MFLLLIAQTSPMTFANESWSFWSLPCPARCCFPLSPTWVVTSWLVPFRDAAYGTCFTAHCFGVPRDIRLTTLSWEVIMKAESCLLESVVPSVDSKVFVLILQQTDGNVRCTIKQFRISLKFYLKWQHILFLTQ